MGMGFRALTRRAGSTCDWHPKRSAIAHLGQEPRLSGTPYYSQPPERQTPACRLAGTHAGVRACNKVPSGRLHGRLHAPLAASGLPPPLPDLRQANAAQGSSPFYSLVPALPLPPLPPLACRPCPCRCRLRPALWPASASAAPARSRYSTRAWRAPQTAPARCWCWRPTAGRRPRSRRPQGGPGGGLRG